VTALYLREDFENLVDEAAKFHQIPDPAFVEKDYHVTEALRAITLGFGKQVIFKGGTSLSKGWNLIHRFSEDIDLYVNPEGRGEKARNSLLKTVAIAVGNCPSLNQRSDQPRPIKGIARATVFEYPSVFTERSVEPTVILEVGIQSGLFPTEVRNIRSLLAEFLESRGFGNLSEDMTPFALTILHYRLTFVEKLFALHDKVTRGMVIEGKSLGKYARHYYDVSQLLPLPEVQAMLNGDEFAEIATDYRRLTSTYFPNQRLPAGMNLDGSPALFPDRALQKRLETEYQAECAILCYGKFPTFTEVLATFDSIRDRLRVSMEDV
jgi:Nucleotidyl transferase AbiEii toxin, Type IV TA system